MFRNKKSSFFSKIFFQEERSSDFFEISYVARGGAFSFQIIRFSSKFICLTGSYCSLLAACCGIYLEFRREISQRGGFFLFRFRRWLADLFFRNHNRLVRLFHVRVSTVFFHQRFLDDRLVLLNCFFLVVFSIKRFTMLIYAAGLG